MREFLIRLHSVQDVQSFVALATSRSFRITVGDGNHTVNGKSFIEMFCLTLTQPLTVTAECGEDEFRLLLQDASAFLASDKNAQQAVCI